VKKTAKLTPLAVLGAVRGLRAAAGREAAVAVDGATQLVPLLAKELRAGGKPTAVREGGQLDGVAALVWVGEPVEDRLRRAARARIPIIAVTEAEHVPYVLDTDLVRVRPRQGFPVHQIAAAIARRVGDAGPALADALPVLREPIVDELIRTAARKNGLIAAAVFLPGVDMPILTLNQVRLVGQIARAYGHEVDGRRALELLGVVGAGFGLRAVAREALDVVPVAGWALKGAFAYTGTKALGEAARRYFATTASVRPRS
jgi:uncharacterized protein (DUF697 family)